MLVRIQGNKHLSDWQKYDLEYNSLIVKDHELISEVSRAYFRSPYHLVGDSYTKKYINIYQISWGIVMY